MAALSAFSDTHGDVEKVLLVSGVVGRLPIGTAVGSGGVISHSWKLLLLRNLSRVQLTSSADPSHAILCTSSASPQTVMVPHNADNL